MNISSTTRFSGTLGFDPDQTLKTQGLRGLNSLNRLSDAVHRKLGENTHVEYEINDHPQKDVYRIYVRDVENKLRAKSEVEHSRANDIFPRGWFFFPRLLKVAKALEKYAATRETDDILKGL